MASMWWNWETGEGSQDGFTEIVFQFTIHDDVDLGGSTGYYLMLSYGDLGATRYYFGLQTNVYAPQSQTYRGKGLIFSRWGTRDLSNALAADTDGWTQSSGHEGDFIGVRRSYDWGAGSYLVKLALDTSLTAQDGKWYGVWITDVSTGVTTWGGSLKFPPKNSKTLIRKKSISTLEIYGGSIKPIDLPRLRVSMQRPEGDGVQASSGQTSYDQLARNILNSDVYYDRDNDIVRFEMGGTIIPQTEQGLITFE